MSDCALRFYRDVVGPNADVRLPAGVRAIYIRSGTVRLNDEPVEADDARFCDSDVAVLSDGAVLWRCEFAHSDVLAILLEGVDSTLLLEAKLTTLPSSGGLMMRCDSVAFPPGGCAYTHTHRGPGIRCLEKGTIRIDGDGGSNHYGPEELWFESGPVPVFAQADSARETRFIRISILPRSLEGKSSITYVLPEDRDKPKSQIYRGYFHWFIDG